jgi:hypothetical protein
MMMDRNGPGARTVSPDSLFAGLTLDQVMDTVDDICSRPHRYVKSMIPAAYRALVRFGACTEDEATAGISIVLKLRTKLMRAAA